MPTIDLSTPPPPPPGLLEGLPRRVALNLKELQHLAGRASDAPLPFVLPERSGSTGAAGGLEGRLGSSPGAVDSAAWRRAVDALPAPSESLARRGLVNGALTDPGLLGAVGLLALPDLAVDLDVVVGEDRARAWHRHRDGAVAALATSDGVIFELAWFGVAQWADELARVAGLPEDVTLEPATRATAGPLDVPLELLEAATEALRSGRADLLPVLAQRHEVTEDGDPLTHDEVVGRLTSLVSGAHGRLRGLAADVRSGGGPGSAVGVVSWTLLASGWHELRGHRAGGERRIRVTPVTPAHLAAALGPLVTEVGG